MSSDRTQLIDQGTMVYPLDAALAQSSEACPNCTSQISPGEQFCPRCGFQRGTWKPAKAAAASVAVATGARSAAGPALFTLSSSEGAVHELAGGDWQLGRGEVDIRIDDGYISRNHARVQVSADGLQVTDLGSSNGTFVGGRRLAANETVSLKSGERISFGRTEFELQAAAAADVPGEAAAPLVESPGIEEIAPAGSIDPEVSDNLAAGPLSGWAIVAESGETIDIPQDGLTIGRKADKAQHVVGDGYVSSLHCRLDAVEDGLQLTDLGSTNGSFIGETRLEANAPIVLADGDSFRIGQTVFNVQSSEGVSADAAEDASGDTAVDPEVNQDLPA